MMNRIVPTVAAFLIAMLAIGTVLTPSAYALTSVIRDPAGDVANGNPDFDIIKAGITETGKLRMVVVGEAGGTKPSGLGQADKVYAYVFVTDVGIVAVTSHRAEDSNQVGSDLVWHSHRVQLDGSGCVSAIEDFGKVGLVDNYLNVANTGATSIDQVLTARLTIDDGKVCVSRVWDTAT